MPPMIRKWTYEYDSNWCTRPDRCGQRSHGQRGGQCAEEGGLPCAYRTSVRLASSLRFMGRLSNGKDKDYTLSHRLFQRLLGGAGIRIAFRPQGGRQAVLDARD